MPEAEVIPIGQAGSDVEGDGRLGRARCKATTSTGRRCRNYAVGANGFCRRHGGAVPPARSLASPRRAPTAGEPSARLGDGSPGTLRDFLRRRLAGDYALDDFGYDDELTRQVLLPLMTWLYERYFRVRTLGVDRIPDTGPALLVANHSGTVPLDGAMVWYSVATEHPKTRVVRSIAANLAFRTPFFGELARKSGAALANEEDARELLRRGELVAVYPEGYKGVGKGWRERYRLQRFGRGGFIQLALRTRVPIVPVAIVGAEETYPMIADLRLAARALGVPYFPVTPFFPLLGPLGAIPLPSKWVIEFGPPMSLADYPDEAADDAMLVFDLADRVRDTIQQMLFRNLKLRGNAFL